MSSDALVKLRKVTVSFVMSVRLSTQLQGKTLLPPDGCLRHLKRVFSLKYVEKNEISLKQE
jgi:hypothetical protein